MEQNEIRYGLDLLDVRPRLTSVRYPKLFLPEGTKMEKKDGTPFEFKYRIITLYKSNEKAMMVDLPSNGDYKIMLPVACKNSGATIHLVIQNDCVANAS